MIYKVNVKGKELGKKYREFMNLADLFLSYDMAEEAIADDEMVKKKFFTALMLSYFDNSYPDGFTPETLKEQNMLAEDENLMKYLDTIEDK